jgi:hypothetical protein
MKKILVSVFFIAAIAVFAARDFSQSKSNVELSDLVLSNIEALALEEEIKGCCPANPAACDFYGILIVGAAPCGV